MFIKLTLSLSLSRSYEFGLLQEGKNIKVEIKCPYDPDYNPNQFDTAKITIDDRCYNSRKNYIELK